MAIIDEIAETDIPALLAINGSVIVRKPIAIPEGSIPSANAIGFKQCAPLFIGPFVACDGFTRFKSSEERAFFST